MDINSMIKLFPLDSNGENIIDIDKEVNDFIEKRLISTYITNANLKKTMLEWQEYYIKEIQIRTGISLEKKSVIINKLALAANNFHVKRFNNNLSIENKCRICNFNFLDGYINKLEMYFDILNPVTFPLDRERNIANIDHIDPISKIGTNDKGNLQTLCWVCNSGKSNICSNLDKFDLFSERVRIENRNEFINYQLTASTSSCKEKINFLPKSLFYRVLNREGSCHICKQNDSMLTLNPIYKNSLFTYDNLIPICYNCLEANDTIKDIRWVKLNNVILTNCELLRCNPISLIT